MATEFDRGHGSQARRRTRRTSATPDAHAGGLDCSGGTETVMDGGELGFGRTVTTVGGECVVFGGTTGATFGGEGRSAWASA